MLRSKSREAFEQIRQVEGALRLPAPRQRPTVESQVQFRPSQRDASLIVPPARRPGTPRA